MGLDYYRILGVNRNAVNKDIRHAFRRLAMKYYPESNPENKDFFEKKFKEVAEAYEVLSEDKYRAVFDKFGEDGLKFNPPENNQFAGLKYFPCDAYTIFERFFGARTPYSVALESDPSFFDDVYGPKLKKEAPQQNAPMIFPFQVTLSEVSSGIIKRISVMKKVLEKDGQTLKEVEELFTLRIPKGIKHGTKLCMDKAGDQAPGLIPSDIIFVVEILQHAWFQRNGDDLHFTATIMLEKALVGCCVEVITLDDRLLRIPINTVVCPGYSKIVEEEGLPNIKTGVKGDLYIHFNVIYPTCLSEHQKALISEAFENTVKY